VAITTIYSDCSILDPLLAGGFEFMTSFNFQAYCVDNWTIYYF